MDRMLFMTLVLALLGVCFLFMGVVAPRGEFLGLNYQQMPGINTPTTTATLGAWKAAHRTVSSINICIALYYFVSLVAIWVSGVKLTEVLFVAIISVGLLMFIPVILVANKAAQAELDADAG
ncbi:hypothetical protein [Corynebacterium sp. H130]|uniref:hypothetical protein n=1 Tax=Corynebacterium sp. H130 TaxID=3133444 RepID=UPI00309EB5BB